MSKPRTDWLGRLAIRSLKTTSGCIVSDMVPYDEYGHVHIWYEGKVRPVHQLSYERFKGRIPIGHVIRHTCDVAGCWNPDHLITGTTQDNIQDCRERDRFAKGSNSGSAVLNECDIPVIRSMRSAGKTQKFIAKHYGVNQSTISRLLHNKNWRHV